MQNTQWFELTSSGAKRDLSLSQLRAFKRFRWYSVKRFALEIIFYGFGEYAPPIESCPVTWILGTAPTADRAGARLFFSNGLLVFPI